MKRFLALLLIAALALPALGVAESVSKPTTITLTPSTLLLEKGDTASIAYTTNLGAGYSVSAIAGNVNVATVSGSSSPLGVTSVGAGETNIVVSLIDDPNVKASCTVTVKDSPKSISASATAKTLTVGDTYKLTASNTDANGYTSKSFKYVSDNADVASVASDGTITAKKAGKANVTVSTHNDSAKAVCAVTVEALPNVNVGHNASSMKLNATMEFTVKDADGNVIAGASLGSSDAAVISVSGSTLTGKSAGVATITATYNGESASKQITVLGQPTSLTVSPSPVSVALKGTVQLVPSIPAGTTTDFTYGASEVSPAGCFTLNSTGLITASDTVTGTGKVVVTTANGLSATVNVTVTAKAVVTATPTVTPTPTETLTPGTYYAKVTTVTGSLNLRNYDKTQVLRTIPQNAWIVVSEKGATWCKTTYGGVTGYVMTKFLTFSATTDTPTVGPIETPTSAPSVGPGQYSAQVTTKTGTLNLRQWKSDNADVIDKIPQYAWIIVTEKGSTWCQTSYNGKVGYVMTKFLTFAGSPTPTVDPSETPVVGNFDAKVTTKSGGLYLREGRGKDTKVLYTIPQNTWIVVTEKSSSWCKTSYAGKTGYVMTSFLTFGSKPTAGPSNSPTNTPSDPPTDPLTPCNLPAKVTTVRGSLNIRDAMNATTGKVIGSIKQNVWITITGRGTDWCRTTYNGVTGYVMTKFLTIGTAPTESPEPSDTPDPSPVSMTAKVTTSGGYLNLRESPTEVTKFVAKIPNGTVLTITQKGTTWCKTSYDGQTGYVRTSYLTFLATK